jgi:hypothetical protein
MTYQELLETLKTLTPEQLAQPVIWSGDERGGTIDRVWIASEDWCASDDGDCEPRSVLEESEPELAAAAYVYIPKGTVHLTTDEVQEPRGRAVAFDRSCIVVPSQRTAP